MKEQKREEGNATPATAAAAVRTENDQDDGKEDSEPEVDVVEDKTPAGACYTQDDAPGLGINNHLHQLNSGQDTGD